jgi:hypothetical protein
MAIPSESKLDEGRWKPTIILRNNPGMLRDAWMTEDGYLVLRQTSFNLDGSDGQTKMLRFSPDEQKIIAMLLNSTSPVSTKEPKNGRP